MVTGGREGSERHLEGSAGGAGVKEKREPSTKPEFLHQGLGTGISCVSRGGSRLSCCPGLPSAGEVTTTV